MADTVKVVVKVTARRDKIADTKKLLLWLAEQSRAEKGCVGYHLLQGIAEPHIFALEEEWDSEASLQAHVTTPHVQQSYAQAGGLVAAAPDRVVLQDHRIGRTE